MNFRESESYLLSLGNEVSAMKLGLENIRKLLAALGNPEKNYLKVQVAGTNGKGSVCAFLDSICLQAAIRTGRFTSPHLVSITERVKIEGKDITNKNFARHATNVREISEKLVAEGALESVPTYFEQVTAIALIAFAEAKVELAILETGLGGRYDATTATNAEIAVITKIDLDHQQYLGETIEEIAAEKAAIIRPGMSVVALRQRTAAARVIRERCLAVGVDLIWATNDITTAMLEQAGAYRGYIHSFTTERGTYQGIEALILGRHQAANAALAIAVAELLAGKHFEITEIDISLGLETAVHPGRLEFVDGILLDGAHNPAGAQALVDFLDENIHKPITMIYGTMRDKDVGEITKILFPKAKNLILTTPANSRAIPAGEIIEFSGPRAKITESIDEAITLANETVGDGIILVTGSLYLVGEVKKILNN